MKGLNDQIRMQIMPKEKKKCCWYVNGDSPNASLTSAHKFIIRPQQQYALQAVELYRDSRQRQSRYL
jgi:hypothetical protein